VLLPPVVAHDCGHLSHNCKVSYSPSLSSAISSQVSSKSTGFSRATGGDAEATPSETTCCSSGALALASEETALVPGVSSGAGVFLAAARLPTFRRETAGGATDGTMYSALFGQFQAKACKSFK
jgi:hypothetical protein